MVRGTAGNFCLWGFKICHILFITIQAVNNCDQRGLHTASVLSHRICESLTGHSDHDEGDWTSLAGYTPANGQNCCTHRLYDTRVWRLSPFPWSRAGSVLASEVMVDHDTTSPASRLVPNYTAWHSVNNLPKVVTQQHSGRCSNCNHWVASSKP